MNEQLLRIGWRIATSSVSGIGLWSNRSADWHLEIVNDLDEMFPDLEFWVENHGDVLEDTE